jgi:hypothetical protein
MAAYGWFGLNTPVAVEARINFYNSADYTRESCQSNKEIIIFRQVGRPGGRQELLPGGGETGQIPVGGSRGGAPGMPFSFQKDE